MSDSDFVKLWVDGPLPGLNEIIDARGTVYGSKCSAYGPMKKRWEGIVGKAEKEQCFPQIMRGCFTYLFLEKDCRRDPSNIIGGGIKIIEDALQETGALANDGQKNILEIAAYWMKYAQRPGVMVFVSQWRCLDKNEAILATSRYLLKKKAGELDETIVG